MQTRHFTRLLSLKSVSPARRMPGRRGTWTMFMTERTRDPLRAHQRRQVNSYDASCVELGRLCPCPRTLASPQDPGPRLTSAPRRPPPAPHSARQAVCGWSDDWPGSPTHIRLGASHSQGSSLTYARGPQLGQRLVRLGQERSLNQPRNPSVRPRTPRDLRSHGPRGNDDGDLTDLCGWTNRVESVVTLSGSPKVRVCHSL